MSEVTVEKVPASYTEKDGNMTYTVADENTGKVIEFTSATAREKLNELYGNDLRYSNVISTDENGNTMETFPPDEKDSDGASLVDGSGDKIDITETIFCVTDDGKYIFKTGRKDTTYGLEEYKILGEKEFIEEIKKILKAQGYTEKTVTLYFDHRLNDYIRDKTFYLT